MKTVLNIESTVNDDALTAIAHLPTKSLQKLGDVTNASGNEAMLQDNGIQV